MSNNLIHLKNLGKTSVHWLNAVGIQDYKQLSKIGSVNAFMKIKKRGFKVSKVLLYSMEAALNDKNWNELTKNEKDQLVKRIDNNKH